ncbi:MAG: isopentenyl-diphosphate Delta-isomerase [Cypionkella sp.]
MHDMIPTWVAGRLVPMEKLAVHQQGLRHKAVSIFVMQGDHILLQQRAPGKYHSGGLWANTCCTHPHWTEAPDTCARRRLDEELGISGLAVQSVGQVEYRADVGNGMVEHEVVDVFVARATLPPVLRPNPGEVAATAWMTLAELDVALALDPTRFTPWLHIYLGEHRERLFGSLAD